MQKKEIPYCFQKQIYKRMALGAVFTTLCFIMFCNVHNERLFMSALLVGFILLFDILYLYIRAVKGEYVRLQGTCLKTESTGIRKKNQYIYLQIDQGILKVPAKESIKDIMPGDMITVYMGLRTLVYQQDDMYLIYNYYVLDHKRKNV